LIWASDELKNNFRIVLAAMSQNIESLKWAAKDLQRDQSWIKDAYSDRLTLKKCINANGMMLK
jgi:hypothetical protein